MTIYYDAQMFSGAPEHCVAENVVFIQSNINQIAIESKEDEEIWENIRCNPDGFLEYLESEIYDALDDELKAEYANWAIGSSDLIEFEFIIIRTYIN